VTAKIYGMITNIDDNIGRLPVAEGQSVLPRQNAIVAGIDHVQLVRCSQRKAGKIERIVARLGQIPVGFGGRIAELSDRTRR
jgi:hypothetical protein